MVRAVHWLARAVLRTACCYPAWLTVRFQRQGTGKARSVHHRRKQNWKCRLPSLNGEDYKFSRKAMSSLRRLPVLYQHLQSQRDDGCRGFGGAKKPWRLAFKVKPWVKDITRARDRRLSRNILMRAGVLTDPLNQLGFQLVGYGCTTCIGNSGPLPDESFQMQLKKAIWLPVRAFFPAIVILKAASSHLSKPIIWRHRHWLSLTRSPVTSP